MSKGIIVGVAATIAVLGGVGYCVLRRLKSTDTITMDKESILRRKLSRYVKIVHYVVELDDTIWSSGGIEAELTEEQKLDHLPFEGDGLPNPAGLFICASQNQNPDNTDMAVTLRWGGVVITLLCTHPDWKVHYEPLIEILTARFYLDLKTYDDVPEVNKKLRRRIRKHLKFLFEPE